MDNNTKAQAPSTTTVAAGVDPTWHLDADGKLLHRDVLISQLRNIGYTGSVSTSVPDLRALHSTKLAEAVKPAKEPKAKKAVKPVASSEEAQARSLKNLERAAARKVTKEIAAVAVAS